MTRFPLLVLVLALVGACDLSMKQQPRAHPGMEARLWANGPPRGTVPDGAVAFEAPAPEAALAPPPVTLALIERGRDRYQIFCTPCHGAAGDGRGPVVLRGFPAAPDFHDPRIANASGRQLFAAVSNGYGVMYGFGDRVSARDRWAIVLYVRSLERLPLEPHR